MLANGKKNPIVGVKINANDCKPSATDSLTLSLPFPPSVNHYLGRRGHQTYKTAQAKAYNAEVYALVLQARANRKYSEPLAVWYQYWMPDKRIRDIANYEKVLTDSMVTAGVMLDDRQIYDIRQSKMGHIKGGAVKVIIGLHVQDLYLA